MNEKESPTPSVSKKTPKLGVVGLGLMGTSIATNLLLAEHSVVGIAPIASDFDHAKSQIVKQLQHSQTLGLLNHSIDYYLNNFELSMDYNTLHDCFLVMECVIEDIEIKKSVFEKIESVVSYDTIMGTNTSAIPISYLQQFLKVPCRFMGIHWAEPAYATRFLEIICGEQTSEDKANTLFQLAISWGKEPTLLKKDIRGFITNRLMYAVYREGLALEAENVATLEDLDKCFRYDVGSWISLMGIFQRMDYIGIDAFSEMLKTQLPLLSNADTVPTIMETILANQWRGIYSQNGLYQYTKEEAEAWESAFAQFNKEMYHLANKYPYEFKNNIDE